MFGSKRRPRVSRNRPLSFPVSHWNDMNIVIVESPAKAKTINKYLGASYEVLASFGHVRDLPAKNGSVDPDANFQMIWEVDPKAVSRLNDIAKSLKGADKLILATDPDREGEAISWHVLEVMKQKRALKDQKIERVVFNAITKQAVTDAMKNPRQIDGALVDAYMARRALDYLVGFTLSPVLWRKLPGARSAGRVQSVALRLVCDRELEIERFVAREYWSIVAKLATPRNDVFETRRVSADGQKIQRLDIGSGAEAEAFTRDLENAAFKVTTVEAKPARRNPPPPFPTSTMQQEASRTLDRDQSRLFELIWNRAVASQMQAAELERTTVDISAKAGGRNIELRATGQVVKFDGFLTLYQEGQDAADDDDESRRLPAMSEGETLAKQAINSSQHFSEPPPRYSEAALVKRMEELGIGRPSTYAAILQVLQ